MDVFVGITGASGAPYARRLVQALVAGGHTVGACFSSASPQVTGQELYGDLRMPREQVVKRWLADTGLPADSLYDAHDFGAPYASGSARWDAAAIVPCSMDTLATIASGAGSNLVHRAASVALKEDRRLVLVPRETPLSTIHLENLLRVRRAGAHVLPAMPAFYQMPESIEDMIDFVVAKILNLIGIDQELLGEWDAGVQPTR
jgi:4-hydroxy-3-polyprenylbenzoate decarboxylase